MHRLVTPARGGLKIWGTIWRKLTRLVVALTAHLLKLAIALVFYVVVRELVEWMLPRGSYIYEAIGFIDQMVLLGLVIVFVIELFDEVLRDVSGNGGDSIVATIAF